MRIGCRIICRFFHLFVVGPFVGSDSSCSLVRSVTGSDQKLDDLIKRSSYRIDPLGTSDECSLDVTTEESDESFESE